MKEKVYDNVGEKYLATHDYDAERCKTDREYARKKLEEVIKFASGEIEVIEKMEAEITFERAIRKLAGKE